MEVEVGEKDENYNSRHVVKRQKKQDEEVQDVQEKEEERVWQDDEPEPEPITDPLIYSGIYAPSGFDIVKILVRAFLVYLITKSDLTSIEIPPAFVSSNYVPLLLNPTSSLHEKSGLINFGSGRSPAKAKSKVRHRTCRLELRFGTV